MQSSQELRTKTAELVLGAVLRPRPQVFCTPVDTIVIHEAQITHSSHRRGLALPHPGDISHTLLSDWLPTLI